MAILIGKQSLNAIAKICGNDEFYPEKYQGRIGT